jgi:branched-chain amino acid transport system permease protein
VLTFTITALIYIVIQSILSLGLNVQLGIAGILNLVYIVFMAAGGYAAALMVLPRDNPPYVTYVLGLSLPFYVGIIAAAVVGGLCAAAVGAVALGRNLRADYFAVVSLVVAVVASQVVAESRGFLDGFQGLINIPLPFGEGLEPTAFSGVYLAFVLGMLLLTLLACEVLRRSAFGRTLRAIREDEVAAEVFGHNIFSMKLKALAFGGVVAGIGGALLVLYVGAFNTAGWSVSETLFIMTCLFVGGTGNNFGVIISTAVIIGLFNQGTQLLPWFQDHPNLVTEGRIIIVATLLLVVLRLRPQGLLPERRTRMEAKAS